MRSNLQELSEVPGATRAGNALPLSRHTFVTIGASACCALALLSLRKPSLYAADKSGSTNTASTSPSSNFRPKGKKTGKVTVPRIVKADAESQQQLSPISYEVTREAGTEQPYTGSTWNLHDRGLFHCICCDTGVFSSDAKFDSGTGWRSFWQPIARENIVETKDRRLGIVRTAVSCRRCDVHLGRVFDDGPQPTGLHYCMNSAVMHFVKAA